MTILTLNDIDMLLKLNSSDVKDLQTFKTRQIDENRKISRRVDEIQVLLKTLSDEHDFFKSAYSKPIENMVEANVNNIWRKINEIAEIINVKKIPHKCPVCEGTTMASIKKVNIDDAILSFEEKCHACDGKGLVWS